jgi:Na+-driven multidrug efflux pump
MTPLRGNVPLENVLAIVLTSTNVFTYLLAGIHQGKPAMVARLPTLPSNIFNLFVRSVGKITRVGVVGHGNIFRIFGE